ncbi:hypothetical protein BCK_03660 [Bacillus cereus FRI-35]|nr:hypothetical protein BCK_03660 [Bacillus cereus FRI-35]
MNKWAILSLACVPYALLTIVNEDTLEIGGSANIFWKIGLFAPLIAFYFQLEPVKLTNALCLPYLI